MKAKVINDTSLMNGFCDFVHFKKNEIVDFRLDVEQNYIMISQYYGNPKIPKDMFKRYFVIVEEQELKNGR